MKYSLKFFSIIFIMCLFFQNSYSQQNTNGWFWTNSQPQGNDLYWVKIIDAAKYYAVGKKGTFMKTTDAGDSWEINSQAGSEETIFGAGGTLTLRTAWFFDANTGLVGGSSSGNFESKIKRTTDGGETFTSVGIGNGPGSSVVKDIYFLDSNTGFLCGSTTIGARRSTNGGLNWTSLPNVPVYSYNCIYASDENNILLGVAGTTGNPRIVVKTTNKGVTWSVITMPGTTVIEINDIEFQNANTGFVSGSQSYFAYTTNGGGNWTQAVFPISQQVLYKLKIIDSTVYTLGSSNSYYYSSNLGVTWDSVNFSDPSNINQPVTSILYSFDIYADDVIIAGFNGKINLSNDFGVTWRNKNYSVGNNTYGFISVFALPGTEDVWSGSEFGGLILHSTNSGANWTKQQTSVSSAFQDFDMINSMTGYAVGGNFFNNTGFCFKTTNGGTNWNSLTIPNPSKARYRVDFVNDNTGWLFGGAYSDAGVISKTTNAGVTWVSQTTTPQHNSVIFGDMYDVNTGYCFGGYTETNPTMSLYKTSNGGVNWNLVYTFPTELPWITLQTFSANTLYLGGENKIYKSTNSGVNWTETLIPTAIKIRNMDWFDLNNGTVVGTEGYTAKTTNAGLTWTERNTGTSSVDGVSMLNKDTVYIAAGLNDYGAILRLYDNNPAITTLNLKIGIEGFWNGTTQISDTVKCHLRSSVSPYNEVEVAVAVVDNTGNVSFNFTDTRFQVLFILRSLTEILLKPGAVFHRT